MFWNLNQASTAAGKVDAVFLAIFVFSVFTLVLVTGLMAYFVWKYSRKKNPKGTDIEGHAWLEVVWTVVPLVLFVGMFYYGWTNFRYMREVPRDAMVVEVTGRQWSWSYRYPNGRQTGDLYVALNRPVKLELHSADVIHGFFVPAFRVKMDVVPGRTNYTWFEPTVLGSFDVECTVICGVKHSYMLSKVHVVPEEEFKRWYFGGEEAPAPGEAPAPAAAPSALQLLDSKNCLTCHSMDGEVMVGPTFKGLYGLRQTIVAGGVESEVTVDDAYLKRSILEPDAEVAKGYPEGAMPRAEDLSEADVDAIVAFIKTLK